MAEFGSNHTVTLKQIKDDRPKHSSGDLHSRLKTRKLLGVGETDDGDIHRSKLSQILGHSDQLYVKLPAGLRVWQVFVALMFTVIGLWALILPSHIFHTTLETPGVELITLPIRLYGGALLSLSIVYWMTLSSQDRDIIRMSLLTCVVYFIIQLVVTTTHLLMSGQPFNRNLLLLLTCRGIFALTSLYFHWTLGQRKYPALRKSASEKCLRKATD
ncbi:tumor protein p53-inducible protein 11 [Aplysia californica]|uniref:Tumor protein p53-inducible protein 11 n=1 Tax=Aplysia californica TaxID=6500 RepID=A0ABM1VQC0_APLCA|nr:tumor protein p53-inducible protein 11 [Aplysia californica]